MNLVPVSIALASALLAATSPQAVTLYDPTLGLPSAQGWSALAQGSAATQAVTAGRYVLDTTGAGVSIWGNGRFSPVVLNTGTGFDLSFSLQVQSEAHTSVNRSGYSVVVVGNDPTQSVELAFWSGNIFAYDYNAADADKFVHGVDAAFVTTAVHGYTLSVRNQQFTLSADGTSLLAGSLHDYTPGGIPYTLPNFVYFGDDSSRGTSVTSLGLVTIAAVPEPATVAMLLAGVAVVASTQRRRSA